MAYEDPANALDYGLDYLELAERVDKKEAVAAHNQIGIIYYNLGLAAKTIEHFSIALSYLREGEDDLQIAPILNNLAYMYGELGQNDKELEYFKKSLKKRIDLQVDSSRLSAIFGNIGISYVNRNELDSAFKYLSLSHKIDLQNGDSINLLYSKASLGEYFQKRGDYDGAELYFNEVEKIALLLGNQIRVLCENYSLRGGLFMELKQYEQAYDNYQRAYRLAIDYQFYTYLQGIYKGLSSVLEKMDKHQEALVYLNKYVEVKDSIFTAETKKQLESAELQQKATEIELLTKKAAIDRLELEKSNFMLYFFATIAVMILVVAIVYIQKHNYKKRTLHILQQQRTELEEKNTQILDSLSFARGIQDAMFATEEELQKLYQDSFVFYQARDVVSGDFLWLSEVGGHIVLAAIDCTGHGVPGAFMTVMANSLLNNIVNERKILHPDMILKELHIRVINTWHQNEESEFRSNGLDAAICTIPKDGGTMLFAGAKRPLYYMQNNELISLRGDSFSVGSLYYRDEISFKQNSIEMKEVEQIYLFTDGVVDQFGGNNDRKFMGKQLRNLLLAVREHSMDEQKEALAKTLSIWQGEHEQTDDMLLVSLKF